MALVPVGCIPGKFLVNTYIYPLTPVSKKYGHVRDVIFLLLLLSLVSVGGGKEIPERGGERARGEVAGFQNSESGALS